MILWPFLDHLLSPSSTNCRASILYGRYGREGILQKALVFQEDCRNSCWNFISLTLWALNTYCVLGPTAIRGSPSYNFFVLYKNHTYDFHTPYLPKSHNHSKTSSQNHTQENHTLPPFPICHLLSSL